MHELYYSKEPRMFWRWRCGGHESRKCGSRGSQAAQPWFRQTVMPQPGLQQPAGRPPCRCSERQAETYRRVERATSAMGGALFRLPEGRSQPHLPYEKPGYYHIYHLYVIETKEAAYRDSLLAFLNENRSEERRVGKECRSRWSP